MFFYFIIDDAGVGFRSQIISVRYCRPITHVFSPKARDLCPESSIIHQFQIIIFPSTIGNR